MITTVIPTYRRPEMLCRAIESAISQSYTDLKVCIYDNASDDDTESVVRDYIKLDSRISYTKNSENIGPVSNMIKGVSEVVTPYYSLLNDDDFLLPDFYKKAVAAFSEHEEAFLVCAKTMVIDVDGRKVDYRNKDWVEGFYKPSLDVVKKMYESHFVPTAVLFRKEVRDRLGSFEKSGSDSLYLTMASASLPFAVVDHYGGAVTLHEGAYSLIGEGIHKEPIEKLYDYLLDSLSSIMLTSIEADRKVQLILLVISSYHQIFESKRLNFVLGNFSEKHSDQLAFLPTLISNRGLVAKLYEQSPTFAKALLKVVYEKISDFRKKRARKQAAGAWTEFPVEAQAMLLNNEPEIKKILAFMPRGYK